MPPIPTTTIAAKAIRILAVRLRPTHCISAILVHKFVPYPEHGLDVPRTARVRLQLSAQILHVAVDRSLVPFERFSLDRIQQLQATKDAARLLGKRGEKLELSSGHVERLVALTHFVAIAVDRQV